MRILLEYRQTDKDTKEMESLREDQARFTNKCEESRRRIYVSKALLIRERKG